MGTDHDHGSAAEAVHAGAAYSRRLLVSFVLIGIFFLIGGITNLFMLPAPTWFAVVDLVGAYLPMGWLGGRWAAPEG